MDNFKTILTPIMIAIGFIVSRPSALVYQASWQRILALQSGGRDSTVNGISAVLGETQIEYLYSMKTSPPIDSQ